MAATIDDLKGVFALRDMPDDILQWILDRSEYNENKDGDVLTRTGDPIDSMWIILEGKAAFYLDMNGQLVNFYNFENNLESGGVGGLLPYSRMKASPGYTYAAGKIRTLRLHKKFFPELEKLSPVLNQRLIAYLTDRARVFATHQLQHEKVRALGKLSAGIAHELNNPASAITRISSELTQRLMKNFDLTKRLLEHCIPAKTIDAIHCLVADRNKAIIGATKLTASQRIQAEDEIRDWLADHGVNDQTDMSETFTSSHITITELDHIHAMVNPDHFTDVISWLENLLISQRVITDLGQASTRISKLVGAIKSHVHMDRTNDKQPTNISSDIENTLTLLGHKLREKNITVEKNFSEHLPEVTAFVGELNQVWMNIFDNAIYAMEKNGKLTIDACVKNNDVLVTITDDGGGISPEVLPKIFDPFFSTKKVGEGTGIGLDIVARIIKEHKGDIKVRSEPGKTSFTICLPVNPQNADK